MNANRALHGLGRAFVLLTLSLGVQAQTTYNTTDWFPLLGPGDERVFFAVTPGQDGGFEEIYAERGEPATFNGEAVTAEFAADTGERQFWTNDATGGLVSYGATEDDEGSLEAGASYGFVTPPADPGNLTPADLDPANVFPGTQLLPPVFEPGVTYTTTELFVEANPDGTPELDANGGFHDPEAEELAITVDDNGGALFDLTQPGEPVHDPEWSDGLSGAFLTAVQNTLKVTFETTEFFDGQSFTASVTQYVAQGIGVVASISCETDDMGNTEVDQFGDPICSDEVLVHYVAGGQSGTHADGAAHTVTVNGSGDAPIAPFAAAASFEHDEVTGDLVLDADGEPFLVYETAAVVPDPGTSNQFTLYYILGEDRVQISAGAENYLPERDPPVVSAAAPPVPITSVGTITLGQPATPVTFTVTDPAGNPVYDADVELNPYDGTECGLVGAHAESTDMAGVASTFIEPGQDYCVEIITFEEHTVLGGYYDATQAPGAVNVGTIPHPGSLLNAPDLNPLNIALVLQDALSISGTVSNGASGVSGVEVIAEPVHGGPHPSAFTDQDGNYQLFAAPGLYRLNFLTDGSFLSGFFDGNQGLVSDPANAAEIDVQGPTTVNVALSSGTVISGIVVDDALVPLTTPAFVQVFTPDFSRFFSTDIDTADGTFSVSVPPGDTYIMEIYPGFDDGSGQQDDSFAGGSVIVEPDPFDDNGATAHPVIDPGYDFNDPGSIPNITGSNVTQTGIDALDAALDGSGALATAKANLGVSDHVSAAVLGVFDPHIVTTFTADQDMNIAAQVSAGTQVHGQVVDGTGTGIDNAFVDAVLDFTNSDADGCFVLSLPTSPLVIAQEPTLDVSVWPGFDPVTGDADDSFIGGYAAADGAGGHELNSDFNSALDFASDGSDWPGSALGAECGNGSETGLLIQTTAGAQITGTVTDSGGQPVAFLWVDAFDQASGFWAGDQTDASGNYSINVQNGTFEVSLFTADFVVPEPKTVVVAGDAVASVDGDAAVTTADFVLSSGNRISGRVTDASGNPIAGMWVAVETRNFANYDGTNTDANGFYSISVAPAPNYLAVVEGWNNAGRKVYKTNYYPGVERRANAASIDTTGGSASGIDFVMTSGASISGTVTGLAQGQRLWLDVWSDSTASWGGTEVVGDSDPNTGEGFTINGLEEAADYRLGYWSGQLVSGNYGDTPGDGTPETTPVDWFNATLLDTTGGNVTGVDIEVSAGSDLTVKLTDDDGADGDPNTDSLQNGVTFDLSMWSDTLNVGGWAQGSVQNGALTVTITGLSPAAADYRLWVSDFQGKYRSGNYQGDLSDTNAGTLVNWDNATLIDMSADQSVLVAVGAGNTISGTVTGLPAGTEAWIDAWSDTTFSYGSTHVTGVDADSDGNPDDIAYSITGLDTATDFKVSIWAAGIAGGYYDGAGEGLVRWNQAGRVAVGPPNASTITNILLPVSAGKSISGTISGLQAGDFAWLDAWSNQTFSWGGTNVEAGGTGSDGYSIGGLESAPDFRVKFFAEGYESQKQTLIDSSSDPVDVDFTASAGGSISGALTGLDPNQWAWIDAYSAATGTWGGTGVTTNASGAANYTISGLSTAGDYIVTLWRGTGTPLYYADAGVTFSYNSATPVAVTSGQDSPGIDFDVSTVGTFDISGTVGGLAAGSNLQVQIYAWSDSGGWGSATRIGNGAYTVKDLPAGNYTVSGYAFNCVEIFLQGAGVTVDPGTGEATGEVWVPGFNNGSPLAVAQDITGLDFDLVVGNTLSGTVTSGGNPVKHTWVNAWNDAAGVGVGANTDASGRFTIYDLADGTYTVSVWTPSGEASAAGVDVDAAEELAPLAVGSTDYAPFGESNIDPDLDLVIAGEAGAITGTVTVGGAAQGGALVFVYDAASGDFEVAAATAADGTYAVDDLTEGVQYRVDVDVDGDLVTDNNGGAGTLVNAADPAAVLDVDL